MSVHWLSEWERDPAKYVKQRLAELSRLDADRVAFARQQRDCGGAVTSNGAPHELSVPASVADQQTTTPAA